MSIIAYDYGFNRTGYGQYLDRYHRTHRDMARGVPPAVSVAPSDMPCTVEEAKLACRISGTDEDSLIADYIGAAAASVELDAEIALVTQTRIQYLDGFPLQGPIELRMPPVQSVSSVTYVDLDGATQTLSPTLYQSDLTSRPSLVQPAYAQIWPVSRPQLQAVAVTFVCGYGVPSAVPPIAKHAIYLRVESAWRNRGMDSVEEDRYWNLIRRLQWRGI